MGLDNFAVYPKEHPRFSEMGDNNLPDTLFGVDLCRGIFADRGNCIRGKVYNSWVEYATGVSLYQEVLSAEDVYRMWFSLKQKTKQDFYEWEDMEGNPYALRWQEVKDLTEWFRVVVENEASIKGWW